MCREDLLLHFKNKAQKNHQTTYMQVFLNPWLSLTGFLAFFSASPVSQHGSHLSPGSLWDVLRCHRLFSVRGITSCSWAAMTAVNKTSMKKTTEGADPSLKWKSKNFSLDRLPGKGSPVPVTLLTSIFMPKEQNNFFLNLSIKSLVNSHSLKWWHRATTDYFFFFKLAHWAESHCHKSSNKEERGKRARFRQPSHRVSASSHSPQHATASSHGGAAEQQDGSTLNIKLSRRTKG